jgi:hypothetical protein
MTTMTTTATVRLREALVVNGFLLASAMHEACVREVLCACCACCVLVCVCMCASVWWCRSLRHLAFRGVFGGHALHVRPQQCRRQAQTTNPTRPLDSAVAALLIAAAAAAPAAAAAAPAAAVAFFFTGGYREDEPDEPEDEEEDVKGLGAQEYGDVDVGGSALKCVDFPSGGGGGGGGPGTYGAFDRML